MAILTTTQVMQLPLAAEAVRAAEERCVGSASLAARLFRPVQRMCVLPPPLQGLTLTLSLTLALTLTLALAPSLALTLALTPTLLANPNPNPSPHT